MSIAMKKILSAVFLLILGIFQLNLFLPARLALADSSLLNTQEGFKGNEIPGAFGNKQPDDIRYTLARIINIVLSLLALIFLVLVLIAGFKYMTAAGNEDKVKESLKQITQAIIGLIIILMAWGITYFILVRLRAVASGKTNYLYGPF